MESVLVQVEGREDGGQAESLQTAVTLSAEASGLGEHLINGRGASQISDDLQDARRANLELVQQRQRARVDVSVNSEVSAGPVASSLVRI